MTDILCPAAAGALGLRLLIASPLGGFPEGWGVSNPLATFIPQSLQQTHQVGIMALHLLLRPPRVKYLTQVTQLNGLWALCLRKVLAAVTRLHLQGALPARSAAQPSPTAVANLPLEKAYLNPFLSS